jgi:hypothetical protein
MNVHQITKIEINRNKNTDEHVRMEVVPGPAYIHIEDAWTRIGELVERDMQQCISALEVVSFVSRQNLDWIKIVQESISIEIVGLGVTIKTNDGLKEVTYGITGLEVI